MSKYIDLSHYHTVNNWDKVKENCPFVISKATEGQTFIDSSLDSFINNCEKKKIPYWLYTFLRAGNEVAQAEFLVKTCKNKIGDYFIGYVLDIESGNSASNVKKALDYLTDLKHKTMIYTMYAQYSSYKTLVADRPANCAWWEARYGLNNGSYNSKYPCHLGADLHQFTSEGTCPGVNGKIDLNRITGQGKSESWFTTALSGSDSEKIEGVNYFAPLQSSNVKDITTFLHNRGLGAGQFNLSKLAEENSQSDEIKEALFKLAEKGLLIRPDGLNKWEEK